MTQAWLDWARGPGFRFALLFMLLGLIRHVVVTALDVRTALGKAGDRDVPYRKLAKETLAWLVPVTRLRRSPTASVLSIAFHAAIIVVPLFLAAHVLLWRRSLGFGWPSLPAAAADVLTVTAVATAAGLALGRVVVPEARALSRPSDYLVLLAVALPFGSGFLAAHPAVNPFAPAATMLVHVLSGELVMVLLPVTKLAHSVLLPASQLVSDVGWRFPPEAGEEVLAILESERRPS